MKETKNCYNCGYRGEVAGSAHSRCKFDWSKSDKNTPEAHNQGIKNGWYNFPLNYDPVWQIGKCEAHSGKANEKMIIEKYDPLLELFAILK